MRQGGGIHAEKVKSEDANTRLWRECVTPGYELRRRMAETVSTALPETELVSISMQGTGLAAADLDRAAAVGRSRVSEAEVTVQDSLPLKKEPRITIFPKWFPWLPWLSFRIQTEVDPQG
jgi:hypothetical protein